MLGHLITFEGADCSGKSTQAYMLTRYCTEHAIPRIAVQEPGGTKLGQAVKRILYDKEWNIDNTTALFLFEVDRTHLYHNIVIPAQEYIHSQVLLHLRDLIDISSHP